MKTIRLSLFLLLLILTSCELFNINNDPLSRTVAITMSQPQDLSYASVRFIVNVNSHENLKLERGLCWSTSPLPVGNSATSYHETGTNGEFSYTIANLTTGGTYYARAFVTNTQDTVYSEQQQFTLLKAEVPLITTMTPYSVTSTSAVSGGEVSFNGGFPVLRKGLIWSIHPSPDISLSTKATYVSDYTSFIHTMRNLTPSTTYYVRAFAESAAGVGYGQVLQFTTLSE